MCHVLFKCAMYYLNVPCIIDTIMSVSVEATMFCCLFIRRILYVEMNGLYSFCTFLSPVLVLCFQDIANAHFSKSLQVLLKDGVMVR